MDDLLKLPGVGPKLAKLLFVIRNQMLRMEDDSELPKRPRQVVSDSDEDAASRVPRRRLATPSPLPLPVAGPPSAVPASVRASGIEDNLGCN